MDATETDKLIRSLALGAGEPRSGRVPFAWSLLAVGAASLAIAVLMVSVWLSIRPGLLVDPVPFAFKLFAGLATAVGAGFVMCRSARPGRRLAWSALLPALLLLVGRGVTDTSGLSPFGVSRDSVEGCVGAILVVSLPALVMHLALLRTAAPTSPMAAGAAAGLVAGGLGAAAYSLACQNDAGLFLMLWYSAALAGMMIAGAVVGRHVLRW